MTTAVRKDNCLEDELNMDKEMVRQILETNLNVKKGYVCITSTITLSQNQKLASKKVFYNIVAFQCDLETKHQSMQGKIPVSPGSKTALVLK